MKKAFVTLLGLCLVATLPGCCWSCGKDKEEKQEKKMKHDKNMEKKTGSMKSHAKDAANKSGYAK